MTLHVMNFVQSANECIQPKFLPDDTTRMRSSNHVIFEAGVRLKALNGSIGCNGLVSFFLSSEALKAVPLLFAGNETAINSGRVESGSDVVSC